MTRTGALHAIVHNATSNRSSEPHRLEDVEPVALGRACGGLAPRRVPLRTLGIRSTARHPGLPRADDVARGHGGKPRPPDLRHGQGRAARIRQEPRPGMGAARHARQPRLAARLLSCARQRDREGSRPWKNGSPDRVPMGRVGDPETRRRSCSRVPRVSRRAFRDRPDARGRRRSFPEPRCTSRTEEDVPCPEALASAISTKCPGRRCARSTSATAPRRCARSGSTSHPASSPSSPSGIPG